MLGSAAWRLLLVAACCFALGGAAIAADDCMRYFPETGKVRAVPCIVDEPSAPSESETPAAPSKSEAPAAPSPTAAAGRQCIKYIPAVDVNVAVDCEEFKLAAPPAAAAPPPPPAASPPKVPATTTYDAAPLKKKLTAMTTALSEAKADTAFRETYCTLNATAQLLHRRKDDKREVLRLTNEHIALEAKVGERGRWVYSALQEKIMDMVLGTPVDDAIACSQEALKARF